MLSFWFFAGLLLLLPLVVITKTLLKKDNRIDVVPSDTALYQQRLMELETDIQNGLIDQATAAHVQKEIQLALLDQTKNSARQHHKTQEPSRLSAILLLILLPSFVIGFYHYTGHADLIVQESLLAELNQAKTTTEKQAAIEKMLTQIEQRLSNQPNDVEGWAILANTYSRLERYPDALRALERLYQLKPDDPTVLLRYAEILSINNHGLFTEQAIALIKEALVLEPDNVNALWLAGLAAHKQGDRDTAATYWQTLLPRLEDLPALQQKITQFLQQEQKPANEVEDGVVTMGNAEQTPAAFNQGIAVKVTLDKTFADELDGNETLFVYAKAIDGSAVPLALLRKTARALPLKVILNDTMAMVANHTLSLHTHVQLLARISKSGHAQPEAGDLLGVIDVVNTNRHEAIELVINRKIK